MSDSVFNLGKFRFRSVSSDVEVFFKGEEPLADGTPQLAHTEDELEQAYQRGVEEGQQPLKEEIDSLQQQLVEANAQLAEQTVKITRSFSETLKNTEQQFIDSSSSMCFSLAELIIGRELKEKEVLKNMILDLLNNIQSSREITIKLSPQDCALMAPELEGRGINCHPDGQLSAGDMLVEQESGFWDATLKTRLDTLKEEFKNAAHADDEGGNV